MLFKDKVTHNVYSERDPYLWFDSFVLSCYDLRHCLDVEYRKQFVTHF